MKLKVQAQHLQPGDIVGSGETVAGIVRSSIHWPSSKVCVQLVKPNGNPETADLRSAYWGKYTEINIERPEKLKCKLCGLEDGACICAHISPEKVKG